MSETGFQVEERDGEIIVMRADLLFIATYYKRANEPQLILRRRTATNDHALLSKNRNTARQLATGKAVSTSG